MSAPLRLATLACTLVLSFTQFVSAEQLAIKGGRVIPIVGEPIADGVILIRDGKIVAVGSPDEVARVASSHTGRALAGAIG